VSGLEVEQIFRKFPDEIWSKIKAFFYRSLHPTCITRLGEQAGPYGGTLRLVSFGVEEVVYESTSLAWTSQMATISRPWTGDADAPNPFYMYDVAQYQ
jgi:hypothetical protein